MKPDTHLLNTESKLSPEVQPFVPNHLKDQKPPGAAVTLDGRLRGRRQHFQRSGWTGALSRDGEPQGDGRSLSPQFPTQKSLTKDSQSGQANRRGSSHSQWAKKAPQSKPSTLDGVLSKQPGQPSRPSSELISHETRRLANMKEGSLQKAGHIKIQQRDADAFEVKLSDFPELGLPAINGSNVTFPSGPQSPGKSTLLEKGESAGPPQTPKSQGAQLKSTQGSTLEPMVSSPTSPTASWAAVACQPPRRAVLRAAGPVPQPTSASKAQQREAKNEQRPEPTSRKKQNKKKKKSKPVDECGEAEVLVVEQEPPKFEDEEEFPNLTHTLIGCTKGQSPAPSFLSQNPSRMHVEGGPAQENRDTTPHADGTPLQDDRGRSRVSVVKPPLPAQPTTESKKGQKVEKLSSKKSKVPVQLDLGNMLAVLEQKQISQKSKQESKPIILSVGGGPPVAQKDAAQKKNPRQPEKMAHNPLDSTCPLVKKGKQREVPKAKKPTPLKRIILKEREERKQRRLLEEWGFGSPGFDVETSENVELEALQLELDEPDPTGEDDPGEHVPTDVEGPAESEPEQADCRKQLSQDTAQHPKIHSRKFRDYCNQMLSKDVDESVTSLLKELVRFQDRLYQKDPMKARMKRRLVMGLREVLKHLKLRKVKCVVISPNCERIQSKGGLDETLHTIIDTCREQSVPFVFALSRKALGRCVNKAVPVSLVGIFNYDGAQDLYHKMIELSSEARKAYEVMIANLEKTSLELQEVSSGQQDADTIADQSDSEEPAYIKIWKRMLEMECDHKFFNFEEQLSTGTMHSEPRAPCEDEGS